VVVVVGVGVSIVMGVVAVVAVGWRAIAALYYSLKVALVDVDLTGWLKVNNEVEVYANGPELYI
jgi:hypothetical protein